MTEPQIRWLTITAVLLVGAMAYINTCTGEFVWDDASSIFIHEHVRDPSKFLLLFTEDQHAFGLGQGNFYRPLLAASFMVDYAVSRPQEGEAVSPLFFHLSNLAWHLAAALLLFALLTRLGAPLFVRIFTPLIFAVHPLQTEAVTYISGRGDPMSATLLFAALFFGLSESSRRRRIIATLVSMLFFVAALLTKESATIFPFLLGLLCLVLPHATGSSPKRRALWARLAPPAIALIILAVYGILRATVLNFGSDSAPREISYAARLAEVCQAFALYLKLLFVPTRLHMERTLNGAPPWLTVLGAFLLAGFLAGFVLALRTKRIRVAAGLAWFLISWFPVSGIIPLNAPMAEHWLYVPMAGFFWGLTEFLNPLAVRPRFRWGVAAVACAGCLCFVGLTAHRNRDWRSSESLFLATLAENPNSIRVHYNLAVTYEDILGNLPGARRHYLDVVELRKARKSQAAGPEVFWDDELDAHLSLGRIYLEQDMPERASNHFKVVLGIERTPEKRAMIGMAAAGMSECYRAVGNEETALRWHEEARKLLGDDFEG